MKNIKNIIYRTIAAALAVTLAAGCVFEKEDPAATTEYRYALVQIGVSTDGMQTKASDDIISNTGGVDGSDKEIAVNSLRVYAYYLDGNNNKVLCGYLKAGAVNPAETQSDPLLMDIKIPFSMYSSEQQVYFMAVANAEGMTAPEEILLTSLVRNSDGSIDTPANFGFDDFDSIVYATADQALSKGMPMYYETPADNPVKITMTAAGGVPADEPGHAGHTNLKIRVPINLTRSLAKIEVYAAEDAGEGASGASTAGIQITGVQLSNVMSVSRLFPRTGEITGATYLTPDMILNLAEGKTSVEIDKAVADNDKRTPGNYNLATAAYYLPENAAGETGKFHYGDVLDDIATSNDLKNATTLKINYKVGTGEEKTGYVVMPPIQRNTYYKVLARIAAGGEMTLTFVVQPWEMFSEELEYGNNVSVGTEGRISWLDGVEPTAAAEVITMGNNIRCEFTIDTPVYSTWEASFIPLEGDQNAFAFVKEVYDSATNTMVEQNVSTVSGNVGEKAELTITPLSKDLTQANKAILRIIVRTNEGRTIVVKNNILSGTTYNNDEYIIIHSM